MGSVFLCTWDSTDAGVNPGLCELEPPSGWVLSPESRGDVHEVTGGRGQTQDEVLTPQTHTLLLPAGAVPLGN